MPAETYARLKKQWKDLYRRHQEFRNIILGHLPQDVVIGERTFSKMEVNVNLDGTMPNISLMEQELVSVPLSGTGLQVILSAVSLKSECSCQKKKVSSGHPLWKRVVVPNDVSQKTQCSCRKKRVSSGHPVDDKQLVQDPKSPLC